MVQVAGKGEDLGRRRSLCRRRGLRADGSASVQSGPAVTGPRPLPREQRVAAIRDALQATFAPTVLEVRDDSHRHAGHAGARDGRGHFDVRIRAEEHTSELQSLMRISYAVFCWKKKKKKNKINNKDNNNK